MRTLYILPLILLGACSTVTINLPSFKRNTTPTKELPTQPVAIEEVMAQEPEPTKEPTIDSPKIDSIVAQAVVTDVATAVEYAEIPPFTQEQQSHVVLSEFRDHATFEDFSLSHEELSQNFCYPANGYLTSDFGWRRYRMHSGVDIKAYYKDPIYATFDGVVRVAMYNGAFGNCIVIRHYNGLETLYAHATKMLVKANQKVKAGEVIALAGKTGRSTGVHLHFEVRVLGQAINPNLLIDTKNRTLKESNLHIMMRSGRIFGSNNEDIKQREAEIKEILAVKYHTVRSGDTLSRIAINNRTTVAKLCALNKITSRTILRIGQRLRVR